MKVDGPGSTRAASSSKKASKAKKTGGAGFAKALSGSPSAENVSQGVSGVGPTSTVDALLSIQQVDDTGEYQGGGDNRQGQAWGEELLERLENIRNGLLLGAIPHNHLEQLAESVSKNLASVTDPRLADILTEIEVRARVELAKYRR